jgi:hypothetical protein
MGKDKVVGSTLGEQPALRNYKESRWEITKVSGSRDGHVQIFLGLHSQLRNLKEELP